MSIASLCNIARREFFSFAVSGFYSLFLEKHLQENAKGFSWKSIMGANRDEST